MSSLRLEIAAIEREVEGVRKLLDEVGLELEEINQRRGEPEGLLAEPIDRVRRKLFLISQKAETICTVAFD